MKDKKNLLSKRDWQTSSIMAGFSLLSSFAYLFYGLGVDILKKMNSDLMKNILKAK
jgi:hypothetical protein